MTSGQTIQLRLASPDDAEGLANLASVAFRAAYESTTQPEVIDQHIRKNLTEPVIHSQLSNPDEVTILAFSGNRMVGYGRVVFGSTCECVQAESPCELNRIYTLPDSYGRGIGQLLLEKAIRIARQKACDVMWLKVWEGNERAIRFYRKAGFEWCGFSDYQFGDTIERDPVYRLSMVTPPARP